ncbi:unnamed protein product, partial [marine sediment metagenome]
TEEKKEDKDKTNEDNGNDTIEMIDCGNDPDCWGENLKDCIPAKFEIGLSSQIRFLYTIKGLEGEKCKIHHLATENPMPELQDTYYICLIPAEGLDYESYESWIQSNFMDCTGSYINVMKEMLSCYQFGLAEGISWTLDGIEIKLIEIGSNEEITVEVDGVSGVIQQSETKIINGVKLKNLAIEDGMAKLEICDN